MAFSSIQTNVAAMINKAYSSDTSATTNASNPAAKAANVATETKAAANTKKDASAADAAKDNPAGASAQVTLGQSGNTTEIYTAQGLLQQMRQIQLSNTMLLFGDDEENAEDTTGLMGMAGNQSEGEPDWAEAISQQPENAAVMIEKAKNSSIKTMLGGS